jgi:hypothetical protein
MKMKPHGKSLGRNPPSDMPYRNLGMVLNGQGPGHHPLGGMPYLDLETVLNEQGSVVASLVTRYITTQV